MGNIYWYGAIPTSPCPLRGHPSPLRWRGEAESSGSMRMIGGVWSTFNCDYLLVGEQKV
jgi:hypothetical protein